MIIKEDDLSIYTLYTLCAEKGQVVSDPLNYQ